MNEKRRVASPPVFHFWFLVYRFSFSLLCASVLHFLGAQRLVHFNRMPPLGRNDISATGSATPCPAANSTFSCCSSVATTSDISIIAKVLPMQTRGPPPKGK